MANFTLTIPDASLDRVRDSFAIKYGWTAELGVTKSQFLKQQLIKYAKDITRLVEGDALAGQARQTNDAQIEAIDIT